MEIKIINGQVVFELTSLEFSAFEAMFNNLSVMHNVSVEGREWSAKPELNRRLSRKILPLHLCRTIGEACSVGNAGPLDLLSLYPFWKYGFAFGDGDVLRISPAIEDPHKKAVAADEFGMGFTAWVMEEVFDCIEWADTSALLKAGAVFPVGTKRPDFVCTFADGSLGIFEAKGTTGMDINDAINEGKVQTAGITAQTQIKYRVAVGAVLGATAKVILLDPPSTGSGNGPNQNSRSLSEVETPGETNLTPDLVAKAARAMRIPPRSPLIKGGCPALNSNGKLYFFNEKLRKN